MAYLIKCRTCKETIAGNAKFCPKCGEREPNEFIFRTSSIITLVVVVAVLVVIAVVVIKEYFLS